MNHLIHLFITASLAQLVIMKLLLMCSFYLPVQYTLQGGRSSAFSKLILVEAQCHQK